MSHDTRTLVGATGQGCQGIKGSREAPGRDYRLQYPDIDTEQSCRDSVQAGMD
jgi:hypothetical protein